MDTGFIGLGAMGAPMARNLHAAGLLRTVWNRSPQAAHEFAAGTGCEVADSPGDLAAASDVIVLCVSDDEAVLDLTARIVPRLRPGALVIDCSTVAAATAREAAAAVAAAGGRFLDCPVTGGTEGARDGTLAVLAGGDPQAFADAQPVLTAVGATVRLLGPVGAGQSAKAVNQVMIAGVNQAVSESLAFASALSLPLPALIEALGGGAAASWFLSRRGPNMASGEFPLGFKVKLHAKDLEICRRMAADLGVRLPLVEMTLLHYRRLQALAPAELADNEDISSLFRLKTALFERDDDG